MSAVLALDCRPVAIADNASVLERVMEEGVELAVWRRDRPAALGWIDNFDWDGIDDLTFSAAVPAIEAEVADGLTRAGYPDNASTDALGDEIAALARRFAAMTGCDAIRLRLEVVETDACRRFHADVVPARLLTTLVGPGTQWIEAVAPDRIDQLKTGDVAIFKGRVWAEEPAILHRSPPIVGTGDTRLLLAIDPCRHVERTGND